MSDVLKTPVDDAGDWRASLPEEFKDDPTLQNINDTTAAAKTLVHQQKMIGSRLPIPKTDEERAELYTKLGRPKEAADYELEAEYMPQEAVASFKQTGHDLGLTPEQLQGVAKWQQAALTQQQQGEQAQAEATADTTAELLRGEYGAKYERNLAGAQRALKVYGNPELTEKLADPRVGNDPDLIRFLVEVGKGVTEDSAQGTTNNSLVMSPMDAKQEIDQINADKSHPYWDVTNPKHKEAQERMAQLFSKAFNN